MVKKSTLFFATSYLSIAPVYWLPGVPATVLDVTKYILIASTAGSAVISLLRHYSKIVFPHGLLGLPGYILFILLSAFSLHVSDAYLWFTYALEISIAFVAMWIFYIALKPMGDEWVMWMYLVPSMCVSLLSCLMIIDYWSSSIQVVNTLSGTHVYESGLADKRGGWSTSAAFYFVPLFLAGVKGQKYGTIKRIIYLALSLPIAYGVLLTTARNGLLAIFATMLLVLAITDVSALGVFIVACLVFLFQRGEEFLRQVRSAHFLEEITFDNINALLSGRLKVLASSLENTQRHILTGSGFNKEFANELGGYTVVHNWWLKSLVDFGLMYFIFTLTWTIGMMKMIPKVFWNSQVSKTSSLVVLSGFLMMVFAPDMFSAFNVYGMWWMSLAVLALKAKN